MFSAELFFGGSLTSTPFKNDLLLSKFLVSGQPSSTSRRGISSEDAHGKKRPRKHILRPSPSLAVRRIASFLPRLEARSKNDRERSFACRFSLASSRVISILVGPRRNSHSKGALARTLQRNGRKPPRHWKLGRGHSFRNDLALRRAKSSDEEVEKGMGCKGNKHGRGC